VLPIASKLWVKLRFMRGLTPRTPPRIASDTTGQELQEGGQDQAAKNDGRADLPSMPSVIPDYDRSTVHGSVAPPVEPFAAGLVGMLPPAEARIAISDPPPSTRGPMVIRVDVPSLSPMGVSVSPPAATSDGQLSAMARIMAPSVLPERDDAADSSGHISSVMPSAGAASVMPPYTKTPASMVPSSEGPEIHVGVVSMPHLRSESPRHEPAASLPTPAPILIHSGPPPAEVPSPTPTPPSAAVEAAELAHPDEGSGVRHVLLHNAHGLLREACAPVLLNRCS
jgi:hypothetical protein